MMRGLRERGFTIIEVLGGLFITSLLAASALPSASEMLSEYRLVSAGNIVAAEIAQARIQAASQQRFVCVQVHDGLIERRAADEGATQCASGSEAPQVTELKGVETSASEVRFDPSGLAVVRDSVSVSNAVGGRVVTTSILGKVTMS